MRVQVSDLYQKALDPVVFAVYNALRENRGVRGPEAQAAWPILGARRGRAVKNKLVGFQVKCGCSLETRDVGAMA